MKKAVVLLSGGIDSTTCLALAIRQYGIENVYALNIHYGQKHSVELKSAAAVADHYKVDYKIMDLSDIMKFSDSPLLNHSGREIKHESYAEQLKALGGSGTVDTYVPFRNGLMLSAAAAYALSVGATVIYYGAHADDAAGRAYPDCTPEFTEGMASAIFEGSGRILTLEAPLINLNKAGVVEVGLAHHAPYELTWSCYEGGEVPCGTCGTCIDRKAAFALNGVEDPAELSRMKTGESSI